MQLATNNAPNHVMLRRRKNVWYSVCDGNWLDPNTWLSNVVDRKTIVSPQPGDDVFIFHNVVFNVNSGTTVNVNNLTITGKLSYLNATCSLIVNGELKCTGTIDQSTGTSSVLQISGYYTVISTYIGNSTSTVSYSSLYGYTQTIAPVTYQNLTLNSYFIPSGGGSSFTTNNTKYLIADLSVNGNLILATILDTKGFNITVGGQTTSSVGSNSIISSSNILFVGRVLDNGGCPLTITGAASIELRGGITVGDAANFTAASSNISFTTNNQTLSTGGSGIITGLNWTVVGAITANVAVGSWLTVSGVLNGTVAGSTFNNNGTLILGSTTLPMATGVFNYRNTSGSTLGYIFNGNYTLPYTTYDSLTVGGTGIKTLSGNTALNFNLTVQTSTLELSTFNLTVTGTTLINGPSTTGITKSGAGSILFIGQVSTGGGAVSSNLSGGNPTIEFRGGISLTNGAINFGTGAISFTTNNQTLTGNSVISFNNPITIGSGVTLTHSNSQTAFNNTITGIDATSIFDNRSAICSYRNATAPMVTGKLYCNQASNTFFYDMTINQDITVPSDPVAPGYYNLTLSGGAVAKKLLGNVSVKHTYTLTSPTTLNSNGFALTNP